MSTPIGDAPLYPSRKLEKYRNLEWDAAAFEKVWADLKVVPLKTKESLTASRVDEKSAHLRQADYFERKYLEKFMTVSTFTLSSDRPHLSVERGPGGGSLLHLIVKMGAHTEVTLKENGFGQGDLSTPALEYSGLWITLEDGASLTLYRTAGKTQNPAVVRNSYCLGKDATLNVFESARPGTSRYAASRVALDGQGASVVIRSTSRGSDSERLDQIFEIQHHASNTKSELYCDALAEGKSRLSFQGDVEIPEGSFFCEAYQKNRNLLLSREAMVETIPKLEIFNDEVKCAHGASVSTVSEDQLYFLEARGIPRKQAETLLVRAFLEATKGNAAEWAASDNPRAREFATASSELLLDQSRETLTLERWEDA